MPATGFDLGTYGMQNQSAATALWPHNANKANVYTKYEDIKFSFLSYA